MKNEIIPYDTEFGKEFVDGAYTDFSKSRIGYNELEITEMKYGDQAQQQQLQSNPNLQQQLNPNLQQQPNPTPNDPLKPKTYDPTNYPTNLSTKSPSYLIPTNLKSEYPNDKNMNKTFIQKTPADQLLYPPNSYPYNTTMMDALDYSAELKKSVNYNKSQKDIPLANFQHQPNEPY
jgi:hypothetical protein